MSFFERVLIADIGVLDAVKEHVHAADAEHGVVEVIAEEGLLGEALTGGGILKDGAGVLSGHELGGGDEEATGAAGGIADGIAGLRGGHLDHELDDVARGAELSILPSGGDLAEHVFVEVALGVLVCHVDGVELIDDISEEGGLREHEEGVLHVGGVGGVFGTVLAFAEGFDEGEDFFLNEGEEGIGREVTEVGPAVVRLGGGENGVFDGLFKAIRLGFAKGVELVETFDEEEVGELLDDGEGIGNAARPHGIPDAVDL